MKKEVYIPIVALIFGEFLMFSNQELGIQIHIANLLAIIYILIFRNLQKKEKNLLESLTLLITLRMVNISMPKFFTTVLLQYPLIYGIMFLPIYVLIKNQNFTTKELGMNFVNMKFYIPLSIVIGTIMGIIEYRILHPSSLIESFRPSDIMLMAMVMFGFIGIVEEIVFRSILQTRLEQLFNLRFGILANGFIFGIMHASYGILDEILFVTIFGIFLAYIFQKTRSLPLVVSIHGFTNMVLFGLLPIMRP